MKLRAADTKDNTIEATCTASLDERGQPVFQASIKMQASAVAAQVAQYDGTAKLVDSVTTLAGKLVGGAAKGALGGVAFDAPPLSGPELQAVSAPAFGDRVMRALATGDLPCSRAGCPWDL